MNGRQPRNGYPSWIRQPWFWLGLGLFGVYLRGLFLDLMDVDATQYASIAMEMLQNGHWLQVQHRYADYLDKPPLLFWASAGSFAAFGLHNWAYKLPSFLGALAGIYAVYRFSRLFYTKETALHAAAILASCAGVLLLCNDVRTDTLLMGMTACAVWQLAEWLHTVRPGGDVAGAEPRRGAHLLFAALFIGLAMLAKGPIGLVTPAFAVAAHLLTRRAWKRLFDWRWLLALPVVGLLLLPMCWGLYQQFDLHPEKAVNGRTGVSGLYFFFWEQSFGRITGENVWKNDTSPFYFFHVYLWAFLPWPLLMAGALASRLRRVLQQGFHLPAGDEAYSLGAFLLTFAALSMSKYKLPHYIFITLPWAAVLTARWLGPATAPGSRLRWLWGMQYFVLFALAALGCALLAFVFPTRNPVLWGVPVALFAAVAVQSVRRPFPAQAGLLVQRSALAFLGVAFLLNFHFYPELLPYQSTTAVPRFARAHGIPLERLAFFNRHGHALDFYAGRILPEMKTPGQVRQRAQASGPFWLYTNAEGRARLDSAGLRYVQTAAFPHFQVALLKPAFLNPATRLASLEPVYLLEIRK